MNRTHGIERSGLDKVTWMVASSLVFLLTFSYMVVQAPAASAEPGADYIQIRSAPGNGGVVIGYKSYFVGETDIFWAAAYNFSSGYIRDVQVYWSSMKVSVGTVVPMGNSTTFTAVGEGVTRVNAYYYNMTPPGTNRLTNTTGNLTVVFGDLDYLQLRDAPNGGGDIVTTRTYYAGDTDTFYAAGYSIVRGYLGDLSATWTSSDETVCSVTRMGLAADFRALSPGVCRVTAQYNATLSNTTGDLSVEIAPTIPRPPTMMKAELTGTGYGDVTLTWANSPDDGGGANDVINYKVLRSEAKEGPYSVVATVSVAGSPSYSWSDPGAGHGDLHNYFYYVVASSRFYDSLPTGLAAKFFRVMSGEKQLISFPLEQADYDPLVVFQTFDFTYARTYIAGTPNPWWCHKPGRFINTLTRLSTLEGYWVDLDGPGTMTIAGLVPDGLTMSLKSGWNMIGFPSFSESYTFADLDADIGGAMQLVEIYDPSAGPYYLQKVLRNAWSRTYLQPGFAYMVRVSVDANWPVPSR